MHHALLARRKVKRNDDCVDSDNWTTTAAEADAHAERHKRTPDMCTLQSNTVRIDSQRNRKNVDDDLVVVVIGTEKESKTKDETNVR